MPPITANDLGPALEARLFGETGSAVALSNLAPFPGGASRETWRFDLAIDSGPWAGDHRLVLRRQLGGKIYDAALDVVDEFAVIRAVHASGVPCPQPFWLFSDILSRPAMVSARLAGESIGRRIVRDPSLAAARQVLPAALGASLALIHQVPIDSVPVPRPPTGITPSRVAIEQLESDLDRIGEPHPALELCLRWLRLHEPAPPEKLVLVHGDYRIGNVLVSPSGVEGIIDWEFAHVGDPAEDLAWGTVREWRFGMDDLPFGGVGQPEEFITAYERTAGKTVDRGRIVYWEILGNARWAVGALNQARRHLDGEEQNLEFASLGRRCAEMELEVIRLMRQGPGAGR